MRELTSEEKHRLAMDAMRSYGREDFLFGRAHETQERLRATAFSEPDWNIDPEQCQATYEEGWQETEAEMQRDGPVLLYLHELLRRMEQGEEYREWAGTAFEEPIFLLKQALLSLEGQKAE